MNLLEGFRIGVLEIKSHKLRSFLTLFGIAIGITSVMSMTGIMSGFQKGMKDGIKKTGYGRLNIGYQPTNKSKNLSAGLVYEDALSIRERFPQIQTVSPLISKRLNFFFKDFNAQVAVNGITPDWAKLDWNYKLRGRFINESDLKEYTKVCILIKKHQSENEWWRHKDPLELLFKRHDPLYKTIRIGHTAFRVVGVIEEGPPSEFMNFRWGRKNVLIPITSFQKRLSQEEKQLDWIDLDTGDPATASILEKQVFGLLKRRHRGVEDFKIENIVDMMGMAIQWANMLTLVMGAVAAIALFAGGVGIMNITLASVNARVKEIGIRKSVGARDKDIKLQFLLEAVALSLLGGTLGVLLGYGASYLIMLAHFAILPPFASVLIALFVSITIGILFSWYPARQAARLDPVEALRYE